MGPYGAPSGGAAGSFGIAFKCLLWDRISLGIDIKCLPWDRYKVSPLGSCLLWDRFKVSPFVGRASEVSPLCVCTAAQHFFGGRLPDPLRTPASLQSLCCDALNIQQQQQQQQQQLQQQQLQQQQLQQQQQFNS